MNGNLPGLLVLSTVSLVFCNFHRWNMRKRTSANIIRYDFSHFYHEEIVRNEGQGNRPRLLAILKKSKQCEKGHDLIIGLFSSHWIQRQSHIGKERDENRGVALQLPFDFLLIAISG